MEISKKVLVAMNYIEAAYPSWKGTESTAMVWEDILGRQDERALQRGVRAYVASGAEFPPNPGQILKASQPPAPDPLEAWGEVQRAVRSSARYGQGRDWSHPLIARAVDAIGGLDMLERELGEDSRAAFRARFVDCMKNLPVHENLEDAYELAQHACEEIAAAMPKVFLKDVPAEEEEFYKRKQQNILALAEQMGIRR